jgi:type III pantothenate kinase
MSQLLVDIGNTRIKWVRVTGGRFGKRHAAVHSAWAARDYARHLFGRRAPARVVIASVAGAKVDGTLAAAARRARVPAQFVKVTRSAGGLTVGYLEPWRLGVDRFVAAVGAHQLFRGLPVCVVGVGTAMTIDLIDARGRHAGGVIIPAPTLLIDALLSRTSGIRRRARGGDSKDKGLFGRSTRSGIVQGSRYAAAALIDRAVDEGALLLKRPPLVVMTGGEAAAVRPLVRSPCVGVPDLVLRGLNVLAAAAPPLPRH